MATKDITDKQVVDAMVAAEQAKYERWPYDFLREWTGQPEKVCIRAMERAEKRGLIECGVSLRTGWLTEKGHDLFMSR